MEDAMKSALVCLLALGCGAKQAAPAASPAARQLDQWLAAFNSADRAALVEYHQKLFPYAAASADVAGVDRELRLRMGTGGFDLAQGEDRLPATFVATLKERRNAGRFAQAVIEVEGAEPHRVVRFEIHPIPPPDALLPPQERARLAVDADKRRRVIDGIIELMRAHYVFPDVAARMDAVLRGRLGAGAYDGETHAPLLAQILTHDLREVSHDRHIRVVFGGRPLMPPRSDPQSHGFGPIERLSGNVARLVIDGFAPSDSKEVREAIAGSMTQVANADALILDLRGNHGGSPETVALVASYLFDSKPVHLNDIYRRDEGTTVQFWTAAEVQGRRFGGVKPIYVLTSRETFSGGEELAYDLQCLRRARLVGETTGGGANPVQMYPLPDGFGVAVPWGRAINPITRTNWDGVGVVPDVAVSAEAALEKAHQLALEALARGASGVRTPGRT
jgi:hypothetical protein